MATQGEYDESVREGSRWLHNPPTADEFAEWFKDNVRLHKGLEEYRDFFLGGMTLIAGTEKVKRTIGGEIKSVERLSFSPYPRVDMRVKYFEALCEVRGWTGEVAPVELDRIAIEHTGIANEHLPHHLFRMPVGTPEGIVHFIGSSMRAHAWEESRAIDGGRIIKVSGPPGTKIVPVMRTANAVDENVVAKAETGAIGRALGAAGMLVIPGSGIATAEDMQELAAGPSAPEPALPAVPADAAAAETAAGEPPAAGELIRRGIARLESHPEQLQILRAWATEKKMTLDSLSKGQERAAMRKVEELLHEAGELKDGESLATLGSAS